MTPPLDPKPASVAELVERLRQNAAAASQASKMIAEAKSARNSAADGEDSFYFGLEPEQTVEWRSADALSTLSLKVEADAAEIAELREKVAAQQASFDAAVQEMSQQFRAVNIARVIEQSGEDIVALRRRAEGAERVADELRKTEVILTEQVKAAEAALAEAVKMIEPFAEFGGNNTDEFGWAGLRCEHERIYVWFGPSDFRAARQWLSRHGGDNAG